MAKAKTDSLASIAIDALCPRCLKPSLVQFPDGFIACERCGKTIAPAIPEATFDPPKDDSIASPAVPVLS